MPLFLEPTDTDSDIPMSNNFYSLPPLSPDAKKDLLNRFTFHPSENATRQAFHESVRDHALDLATHYSQCLAPGRELDLALTKIEEAMMWANAGVARVTEEGARR